MTASTLYSVQILMMSGLRAGISSGYHEKEVFYSADVLHLQISSAVRARECHTLICEGHV